MLTRNWRHRPFTAAFVVISVTALCFAAERPFSAKVIGISDGDTITVLRDRTQVTVRLDAIDCPESGQPYGQRAKQFTSETLFGRIATVHPKDRDRYGRLVARVFVGDTDVSLALVHAGYAWHFTRYSNDPSLASAEQEARNAHRGLWQDLKPIPPWDFRHPPSPVLGHSTGPYHGNVNSRALHAPGCPYYDCKNCTLTFATLEAARAAGYRPHTACIRLQH